MTYDYPTLCSRQTFNLWEGAPHGFHRKWASKVLTEKRWINLVNRKANQEKICETLEEATKEAIYLLDL
jgi:hypothetical protein